MPTDTKAFSLVPHDWHSSEYVSEWITRDATRDRERRPLLQKMLSATPFPHDAALQILDVGAGYGVVSEEALQAFPAARITLQDYSRPMLDRARQRLADYSERLRYVMCDLTDPSWPQQVGGPFDIAVSAIAIHNLRVLSRDSQPPQTRRLFLELRPVCRRGGPACRGATRRRVRPRGAPLARAAARDPCRPTSRSLSQVVRPAGRRNQSAGRSGYSSGH